jgi:crotonobetainyl-CoA:carnitine CoA-transferase CaiB-like acyl-CoA transferase
MEALKDVRILDMTHVQAGPTCSQLLAWMGADVIKFENPQGDATRGQLRDVPNADSLYFTMLNCNKRSITVNMKTAATCSASATSSWRTSAPACWSASASAGRRSAVSIRRS